MTTKIIGDLHKIKEVTVTNKDAAHLEVALVDSAVNKVDKIVDSSLAEFKISLQGVFLPSADANIPHDALFTSWQEALYKILLLPETFFEDLKPEGETGPNFLNLDFEQLLNVPIDLHAEQILQNSQLNVGGGVISQITNISFDVKLSSHDNNQHQILSVPESFNLHSSVILEAPFAPQILVPVVPNPSEPVPFTPTLNADGALLAKFNLNNMSINEYFLNSYSQIEIDAHLLTGDSSFGFDVGATPGNPAIVTAVNASFSSSNANPNPIGTQVFPTHIILTTLQGNTLALYTADDPLAGHVRGDLIYTINNPLNTQSLASTNIDLGGGNFGSGYSDKFLYSVLNNFSNLSVGLLNFNILDDKPVTSNVAGPLALESAIQTDGSSNSLVPEMVGGQLLTTLPAANGTLIIAPNASAPVSIIPANISYFGADKAGAFVSMVSFNNVSNATNDGVNPVTEVSNIIKTLSGADVAAFAGVGINNVSVGDQAYFITDSLGNTLLLDRATGAYLFTLNNAYDNTSPASPSGNVGGAGVDAMVNYLFQLTDGDGSVSTVSTLSIDVIDDVPVSANVSGGAISEANIQNIGSNNSGSVDQITGNILATAGNFFGADKQASSGASFQVSFNQVSNATVDGVNPIALQSSVSHSLSAAEITQLGGGNTSDAAVLITDTLGNTLLVDEVTGRWLYTLNNAMHATALPAVESYNFVLIDSDGSVSNTSLLSISITDDAPIAIHMTGSGTVNEAGLTAATNNGQDGTQAGKGGFPTEAIGTLSGAVFGADHALSTGGYSITAGNIFGATLENGNAITFTTTTGLLSSFTDNEGKSTLIGIGASGSDNAQLLTDSAGNTLLFDQVTGSYVYKLNTALKESGNAPASASFAVQLTDSDGNTSTNPFALNITINEDFPRATNMSNTGDVFEAGLSGGSGVGSTATQISGILSGAMFGADGPLSTGAYSIIVGASTVSGATLENGGAITYTSSIGALSSFTIAEGESILLAQAGANANDTAQLITDSAGNTLLLDEVTGGYVYTLNTALSNDPANNAGNASQEIFAIRLSDNDGSTNVNTSGLIITVNDDAPNGSATGNGTLSEANLATGSNPDAAQLIATGNLGNTFGADGANPIGPISFSLSSTGADNTGSGALIGTVVTLSIATNYGLIADVGHQAEYVQDALGNTLVVDLENFDWAYVLNSPLNFTSSSAAVETFTLSSLTDNDGSIFSSSSSIAITIHDDSPVISTPVVSMNYVETGSPVVADNNITLSDVQNANLAAASVSISNNFSVGDILAANTAGTNIIASYDAAQGILSLSGTDTLAHYQSVLDAITFSSTSLSTSTRTLSWNVTDADGGGTISNTVTSDINVALSPVVLDLSGAGIHLTSALHSGVTLGDVSGTNNNQLIGWITEGEGVLMLNSNGNGLITNVNQIAFSSYVPGAQTDLQGLIAFDSNHNEKLDAQDNAFNQFGVLLANNKFESLTELGITSISLTSNQQLQQVNGNTIYGMTTYQTVTGETHQAADVAFGVANPANQGPVLQTSDVFSNQQPIDFSKLNTNETNDNASSQTSATMPPLAAGAPEAPQDNANLLPAVQVLGEQLHHDLHPEGLHS